MKTLSVSQNLSIRSVESLACWYELESLDQSSTKSAYNSKCSHRWLLSTEKHFLPVTVNHIDNDNDSDNDNDNYNE